MTADPDMIQVRADELNPGDLVDLSNDPHESILMDPLAEYELIPVSVVWRNRDNVEVGYESVGKLMQRFNYNNDHVFQALRREIDPERFEE